MKRQTRKMMLNLATGVALAATAAVVLTPATATAAPGYATASVNIRSGPGTNFQVLGQLSRGQAVEVVECASRWCQIEVRGRTGYVSRSYIAAGSGGGGNPPLVIGGGGGTPAGKSSISFGFGVGTNGPSFQFGVNQPQPQSSEVCFYDRTSYRGNVFCLDDGERIRNLSGYSVSSIRNQAGYDVTVCSDPGFSGSCRTYVSSTTSLGFLNGDVGSVRID